MFRLAAIPQISGPSNDRLAKHFKGSARMLKESLKNKAESEQSHKRGWGIYFWVLGFLLIYILSTGPVEKLCDRGLLSRHTVDVLYTPLSILCVYCEPVRVLFNWYILDVWSVGSGPSAVKPVKTFNR